MKNKLSIIALMLALILLLTGCFCDHQWVEANCVNPKTCANCDKTEGSPAGHSWLAATCEAPKTCENCNATEGEPKAHQWEDATCIAPKKCAICYTTEGDPAGHSWEEATTEAPKTCSFCQITEGSKLNTDPRFTTAATKHLQGKWSCEVNLTGEMIGAEGYIDQLPCTLYYVFGNTGELTGTIELHDRFAFLEAIKTMTADIMYQSLAAQGIGKTEADQAMVNAYGMTMEEYVDAYVENMDMDDIFGAFTHDGVYYVGENGIYVSDSWYGEFEASAYTLENGVLIIEDDVLEEGGEPLKWTKVQE